MSRPRRSSVAGCGCCSIGRIWCRKTQDRSRAPLPIARPNLAPLWLRKRDRPRVAPKPPGARSPRALGCLSGVADASRIKPRLIQDLASRTWRPGLGAQDLAPRTWRLALGAQDLVPKPDRANETPDVTDILSAFALA